MYYKIENGCVNLGGRDILANINFTIKDNDHIGIVGHNGSGKSTLLKAISGIYDIVDGYDRVKIECSKDFRIGYVKQNDIYDRDMLMGDFIRGAFPDIVRIEEEIRELEVLISKRYNEKEFNRYTDLLNEREYRGGSTYKKEIEVALNGFGFSSSDKDKVMGEFSGGQVTKLSLIRLLLSKPDLLLLDEPTNHLDIGAMEWLEEYLRGYGGAFVLVSHDRMLLDRVCDRLYEISYGELKGYSGNYSFFIKKREEDYKRALRDYEMQQREIKRLMDIANRFKYKPSKASMAMAKLKMIERMVKIDKPERENERGFRINLSADMASYREVLRVKNLVIGYGKPLARVNMVVTRGDNVAIMGVNGCGKSTFIKTLMGEVSQIAGKFSFGERVNIGYFSQDLGNLDFDKCIYEEIEEEASNLSSQEIRDLLGSFGFSGDDVFKRIRDLSGGEKVRVSLCKVFYKRPNVLILDEPTNHLDIVNRENIQRILGNYEGTIILVSHDRYLIRNVCDMIVVMDGKGEECRIFEGGYDEYLEKRERERNLGSNVNGGKEKKSGKARNSVNGKGKEESAERRALRLEREIVALEERLGSLNEELLKEEVYMDASRARLVQVEIDLVQGDIERKTAEWDRIVSEM